MEKLMAITILILLLIIGIFSMILLKLIKIVVENQKLFKDYERRNKIELSNILDLNKQLKKLINENNILISTSVNNKNDI